MFNYLYNLILLLIIAPRPELYKETFSLCSALVSRRYQSLQAAWDECAKIKNCKGVIEQNCSGNSFYACGERVQNRADGFNGCFYVKPGAFWEE